MRNAIIIFVSLLLLAVIIVLCIFFASKFHCPLLLRVNQTGLAE